MAEPLPTLTDLRRMLTGHSPDLRHRRPLGVPDIDAALGGGLLAGAVHELQPSRPWDHGAASGFAAALATLGLARVRGPAAARGPAGNDDFNHHRVLWIQQHHATNEAGALYGPEHVGLPLQSLVIVQVPRVLDALWAFEEALKCRAVATVIAELAEDGPIDLTATRRLALAARDGGGLGLLLRGHVSHRASAAASAATTRWEIASAAAERDRFGGLGRTSLDLSLIKNRCGPCGRWIIGWDHHERTFLAPTLSHGVAQTARDRSARAQSRRIA
jgi:protein ImuA